MTPSLFSRDKFHELLMEYDDDDSNTSWSDVCEFIESSHKQVIERVLSEIEHWDQFEPMDSLQETINKIRAKYLSAKREEPKP